MPNVKVVNPQMDRNRRNNTEQDRQQEDGDKEFQEGVHFLATITQVQFWPNWSQTQTG
jgi:hypothetical protein